MSVIRSQAEYDQHYPTLPIDRWRTNVIEAAIMISDADHQQKTWLHSDREAWETPDEVICVLFDDSLFELFLTDCDFSLSDSQRRSGQKLFESLNRFLPDTPQSLDPQTILLDPRWEAIRVVARDFVESFANNAHHDE